MVHFNQWIKRFYDKACFSVSSEPVPFLEPVLRHSTAKEMALGQVSWFQSSTNTNVESNYSAIVLAMLGNRQFTVYSDITLQWLSCLWKSKLVRRSLTCAPTLNQHWNHLGQKDRYQHPKWPFHKHWPYFCTDISLLKSRMPGCGDAPAFVTQDVGCNRCKDRTSFCIIVWKTVFRIGLRYTFAICLFAKLHNVFCIFYRG